jgi:small-conductance mechanosensitive channel
MSYNWGPHYIVPSEALKSYSGIIQLREELDEDLLHKELESLGMHGTILKITNPWYYRRKNRHTWIKIGESADKEENFPTSWDTRALENGQYEIMGLMHVFVKKADTEVAIARQNIVEVMVEN